MDLLMNMFDRIRRNMIRREEEGRVGPYREEIKLPAPPLIPVKRIPSPYPCGFVVSS
jgi:hypothetical protein